MDKTFDDIKDMLKANYPLLYLATSEYGRALQKLRRIAYEMDYAFYSWDNVDGLQSHVKNQSNRLEKVEKHKAHQETKGYQELLEYIKRDSEGGSSKKEIYVVEDFHKYFKDDKVIVYLRKLTNILKSYDKHLVLMSPFLKLPDELEKYVTILNVPLPDRDDLKTRLATISGSENINPDLEKYLIDSALGMTDMEADLAFRLAKEKVGLNSKDASRIIANEKEQIIKKSGILDYYQVNEDLEKSVGGLNNLKTWLKQRSKAFERKA